MDAGTHADAVTAFQTVNKGYSRLAQQIRVLDIATDAQKQFMEQMTNFQNNVRNLQRAFMNNLPGMHESAEKE